MQSKRYAPGWEHSAADFESSIPTPLESERVSHGEVDIKGMRGGGGGLKATLRVRLHVRESVRSINF